MTPVAAIAWLLAVVADPPAVDVQVALDPPVIPFHRQARYTITVETPEDVEVRLPDMLEQFGGLAVADIRRDTKSLRGGRRRITETYTLDPVFIGDYPIQPASVAWGEGQRATVPSPALRVRDLTEEEIEAARQFAPIAGTITPPHPLLQRWWLWLAIVAALALAAGAAAYALWFRKREHRAAPPVPAWEVAYARLRELDQRQLPKAGQYGPYYVELSGILRHYIEDRFQLHAPEQTTPEFLFAAAGSGVLSEAQQRILAGFLEHCDRVKFAQHVPEEQEMDRSFATVLHFVDETTPHAEAGEQEAAA